jgi:hypothetical protein
VAGWVGSKMPAIKISRRPLENFLEFFYFFEVVTETTLGALGARLETGTGRVRCLIPNLLFGGFGYAHL